MRTNIRPTKGRIAVEPILERESFRNGLIIPCAHQDPSTEGTVVSVSTTDKSGLKIGQRVIFARHGGQSVKQGRRMFKLLDANEIYAVIEQD